MEKPVLGYWDIRGLAQPCRLLLQYLGVEYEDRLHKYGPAPDYSPESWLSVKFNLGLRFPNNPYFIDGDIKMTESNAILKYIARTRGPELAPTDARTLALVDEIEGVLTDLLKKDLIDVTYGRATFESRKDSMTTKLDCLDTFLQDRKYVIGEKITYIDFFLYEALFQYGKFGEAIKTDILKPFHNLLRYKREFESLPQLTEYIQLSANDRVYSPHAKILY